MRRKTVNVDKLDRKDISTNELQEVATLLLRTLAYRADQDYGETCSRSHTTPESEKTDCERRDALEECYQRLKAISPRGEGWRFKGA